MEYDIKPVRLVNKQMMAEFIDSRNNINDNVSSTNYYDDVRAMGYYDVMSPDERYRLTREDSNKIKTTLIATAIATALTFGVIVYASSKITYNDNLPSDVAMTQVNEKDDWRKMFTDDNLIFDTPVQASDGITYRLVGINGLQGPKYYYLTESGPVTIMDGTSADTMARIIQDQMSNGRTR